MVCFVFSFFPFTLFINFFLIRFITMFSSIFISSYLVIHFLRFSFFFLFSGNFILSSFQIISSCFPFLHFVNSDPISFSYNLFSFFFYSILRFSHFDLIQIVIVIVLLYPLFSKPILCLLLSFCLVIQILCSSLFFRLSLLNPPPPPTSHFLISPPL